jgi:putative heme-binding domain-containing protein
MRSSLYAIVLLLAASLFAATLHAQQKTVSEDRLFSANCAACHGSDGHGGERAPSIATLRSVISLSNADLEGIVGKGIPGVGMPAFGYLGDAQVRAIVAYLRTLQGKGPAMKVSGDPKNGRTLFYGKAECSKCHMINGEGGFIAADLSSYGDSLSPAAVRRAIVEPNRDLEPESKVVEIYTADDQHIAGLLRDEDNFTVYLQTEDGRYLTFAKANLRGVRHTGHSIMPGDYEARLSSKELEDVVSFLIATASVPRPIERGSTKRHRDDD